MSGRDAAKAAKESAVRLEVLADDAWHGSAAVCYRDDSGKLARLHCECGTLSDAPEWSSAIGPQCPECAVQYREVFAQEMATEETQAPEIRVTIDADGLVNEAQSRERQALTNEWLELTLRQEMIDDELASQKAAHGAAKKKIKARVAEIRAELQALRTGVSCPPPQEPESPEARQLRIQGT